MAPSICSVVLNWHGRAATLACLRALSALSYPRHFLILIDNGCQEFSADEVRRFVVPSDYLRTERNLGFAGGANLGMRHALAGAAEYVWFLNNDACPEPDALREMVDVAGR